MQKSEQTANKQLLALRKKYAKQLGPRVADIEKVWGRIKRDVHKGDLWEEFHQLSHSLAGSGATFGFPGVSKAARAMELLSGDILDKGPPPNTEPFEHVANLLTQLKRNAADPDLPFIIEQDGRQGDESTERGRHLILVVDGDHDQAHALASEVGQAGYAVQVLTQPKEILDEIAKTSPAAILLSIVFPGGRDLGLQVANRIHQTHQGRIPVIFTSTKQDFETRLAAVRAGGAAYFVKPLQVARLVDRLDRLIAERPLGPYRVLLTEDDPSSASRHAAILEAAGMITETALDPAAIPEVLRRFDPEAIVASHQLRHCTGLELARVVRHQEAYAELPIVFLVPDAETGMEMIRMGLDDEDFVETPINPDDLVALVSRRVMRVRYVRATTAKDNLSRILVDSNAFVAPPDDSQEPASSQNLPAPTPPGPRVKVLVVEDDAYIIEAIRIKLTAQGMEVLKAKGGTEGFNVAYQEMPDVIITDYNMPEGSGDYLLARLRSNLETRDMPVIVITGRTFGGRPDFAVERDVLGRRGAAAFLAKPLNLDALVEVVQRNARRVNA